VGLIILISQNSHWHTNRTLFFARRQLQQHIRHSHSPSKSNNKSTRIILPVSITRTTWITSQWKDKTSSNKYYTSYARQNPIPICKNLRRACGVVFHHNYPSQNLRANKLIMNQLRALTKSRSNSDLQKFLQRFRCSHSKNNPQETPNYNTTNQSPPTKFCAEPPAVTSRIKPPRVGHLMM